jgi:hypothetical protein
MQDKWFIPILELIILLFSSEVTLLAGVVLFITTDSLIAFKGTLL